MKLSEKTIILPGREEMLRRLLKTSQDPMLVNRFYPVLLKSAGQEKHGVVEVVVMFIDATNEANSLIASLFARFFPEIIIDDQEVARQAKAILQKFTSMYIKRLKKQNS